LAPSALQLGEYLVRRCLTDQHKQGGGPVIETAGNVLHEIIVNSHIGECAAEGALGRAGNAARMRILDNRVCAEQAHQTASVPKQQCGQAAFRYFADGNLGTTGRSNHLVWLFDRLSLVECNLAAAHIVHGAHQPDLTLVDHIPQHNAPVAKLLHGELDIHFRHGLDESCVL